ncbi:hypothetical protein AVEN_166169-1 [Araneus ventricosus]|uniref:Uncharacterized protein n=1 Tax=Araneus ventricosus TaxID=182803 RepID=A0A4Y2NHA8_ARAVE|nr:hypothetical protein AVEN_166169-1 [Araneus ventricosus]
MTRVQPFDKVEERFASQQGTRFSVRVLVRFPQAFITSLFHAFSEGCKEPTFGGKIEPSSPLRSRIATERNPLFSPLFKAVLPQTSNSSKPGIEPAFLELESKHNNHCTGRGCTRWDRFIKKLICVNFVGMVSETVCAEMLSRTAYGK